MRVKNLAVVVTAAAFLGGFMLWGLWMPDEAESLSERRPLAAFPAASGEAVLSGSFMADFERYALDQFPLRTRLRTVKAVTTLYILGQKDNNGIYIRDGFASKLEYPMNADSMEYAASRFRFVYDKYMAGKSMKVYFSLIPDKNYFMAKENGYPSIDYEAFAAGMKEKMAFAEYIDIYGLLEQSDYYRTDSHWRQERITDVAEALSAGMGAAPPAEYTVRDVAYPFYGVYYGQSALPLEPDRLYCLDHDALKNCKSFDYETDAYVPIYDLEKAAGRDPYEIFLAGPKPLITIENPNAGTEKELVMFRDSFGSSIAPLLAQGYAKITLVDIRYIPPALLGRYISFENQDALFLYSVSVLNHSAAIK